MTFIVTTGGEVNAEPEPTEDDRHRARLLAQGGNFGEDAEELFARGIAVARNGGDVREFLRGKFLPQPKGDAPSP